MATLNKHLEGESLDPEHIFQAVGNEVRIGILRRLADATEPVPFTTIQEELELEDSGKFNYHLGKLTEHFIRKTPHGYELSHAGWAVIKAIRSGSMTHDPHIEPLSIPVDCPYCGEEQTFHYKNETIELRCQHCDGAAAGHYDTGTLMSFDFPVSGLRNRDYQEAAYAAHRLYDAEVVSLVGGVCPECAGTVVTDIELCQDHECAATKVCETCQTKYAAWSEFTCEVCNHQRKFPPWFKAMLHPTVISFFHEVADITEPIPFPKLMSGEGPDYGSVSESVRATDPIELAFTFECQGEECTVVLDEALEIEVEEVSV